MGYGSPINFIKWPEWQFREKTFSSPSQLNSKLLFAKFRWFDKKFTAFEFINLSYSIEPFLEHCENVYNTENDFDFIFPCNCNQHQLLPPLGAHHSWNSLLLIEFWNCVKSIKLGVKSFLSFQRQEDEKASFNLFMQRLMKRE